MENGYYNYYIGEKRGIIGKSINAFLEAFIQPNVNFERENIACLELCRSLKTVSVFLKMANSIQVDVTQQEDH